MSETPSKGGVALKWLDNPIIIYGGGFLLVLVLARLILPGIFDWLKKGFGVSFDWFFNFVSSILGQPSSQDVNNRSAWDSFRGIFTVGDRAASDLVDRVTFQHNSGGQLTDYASARKDQLIRLGYMTQDGNFTAAGLLALHNKTIPPLEPLPE